MRLEADGAIQFWIHRPGDPSHGLLTRRVTIIKDGLQTPTFTTLFTDMR